MLRSKHLRVLALLVLLFGFGSAGTIYLTAEPTPVNSFDDRFASKKYVRELERFGGKFAVLTAEFNQWFTGLWHGKSLAIVVGICSMSLALLLWFLSTLHSQTGKGQSNISQEVGKCKKMTEN